MIIDAKKQINGVVQNGNGHKPKMYPVPVSSEIISKEISNPALKVLAQSVLNILSRAQNYEIDKEQAAIEIQAHRQLINIIVLDWNSKLKDRA